MKLSREGNTTYRLTAFPANKQFSHNALALHLKRLPNQKTSYFYFKY